MKIFRPFYLLFSSFLVFSFLFHLPFIVFCCVLLPDYHLVADFGLLFWLNITTSVIARRIRHSTYPDSLFDRRRPTKRTGQTKRPKGTTLFSPQHVRVYVLCLFRKKETCSRILFEFNQQCLQIRRTKINNPR